MRLIIIVCLLHVASLASAADPSRGVGRERPSVSNVQPERGSASKAGVEQQVAQLHARLRDAQNSFSQVRDKFDILKIKLGDPHGRVFSLLLKEFPKSKNNNNGAVSGSECVARSVISRRNGDCVGYESKPSGDPNAYNPQTRRLSVYLTDKGRVYALYYTQENLYVASTLEGCQRERDSFISSVLEKYGQPFGRNVNNITWGAAMPYSEFQGAYIKDGMTLMGVQKSLDGDVGFVNDEQKVIYFQRGFSLTVKCLGSNGNRVTMGVNAFLTDKLLEQEDVISAGEKPKL